MCIKNYYCLQNTNILDKSELLQRIFKTLIFENKNYLMIIDQYNGNIFTIKHFNLHANISPTVLQIFPLL